MKVYRYRFRNLPVITHGVAKAILDSAPRSRVSVTLDMGLSKETVYVEEKCVIIRGFRIPLEAIKDVLKDKRAVYAVLEGRTVKLARYANGNYYKLRCVGSEEAPTLEINGIHMHRISGTTPWRDSESKVRLLSIRRGSRVLDLCTGLGYTAAWALKMGAGEVLTVEKDPNVLEMASYNPWSRALEDQKITIILGDASKIVKAFKDESFDRIMHDPPRLVLAGELYSLEFYGELHRVLKPGGLLVHYTGQPGYKRGKDIMGGVKGRLEKAGFTTKRAPKALSVIAVKPRV